MQPPEAAHLNLVLCKYGLLLVVAVPPRLSLPESLISVFFSQPQYFCLFSSNGIFPTLLESYEKTRVSADGLEPSKLLCISVQHR